MGNTKRAQSRTIGLGRAKNAFAFAALFSGFINVLMLTGPLFMIQVYDRVLTSKSVPTLLALSLVAAGLYVFMGLLEFVRTRIMVRVGALYDEELRMPVFDRMLWHSVAKTPGVGTQPIRDLDTVRQFVSGPAPFSLFDMPWVPVYIAVHFLFHPWLGYLSLGSAALLFSLAIWSEVSARRGQQAAMEAALKAHVLAEEAANSADVVKALGMQRAFGDRWSSVYRETVAQQGASADQASVIGSLSKVIRLVLQSAGLGLGAYLAVRGDITAGVIIAATTIMSRALAPVEQAIGHWRSYVGYRKARERLDRLLTSVDTDDQRMELPTPKGALSVEGLSVVAPQSRAQLLHGITFDLKPGGCLGIVGPTGAGKSCLARAIVGIWPAGRGTIRLDGASLEQWPAEQLGRHIGYVPQDVVLLSGTIQDNISRFAIEPDPVAVVGAARRANVHDMILALPDGYNTMVGPAGVQLSGGQRQRIALARALYGDPALLVLDEPNSNLDGDGEAALMGAIHEARQRGTTVVVIAHRPSALRAVEHVLFLKDGRQIEFGLRDAVLQKLQAAGPQPVRAAGNLAVVKEQV
ncbi:MAG: type I secretion system permease/ATPase [Hyphomicrobiaceae bacterium]|nr:type I secretion system permease/ATPase [Hyphomicrobiaceae bacterium]